MRHTLYTCDRCGRQLREDEMVTSMNPQIFNQKDVDRVEPLAPPDPIRSFEEHDFCLECLLNILTYAITAPKGKPAEKPEAKAKTKPAEKVDVGKIGALYMAGWSAKEIADELQCSEGTVYYHLKRIKENDA